MSIDLDLLGRDADRAYAILAALVTPRPIAWVTTLNEDGSVNAAPFSFFNVFGDDPPLVIFAPGDRDDGTPKDTARNCRRTGEFVINLLDEALAAAMVRTSAAHPYGTSETEIESLETAPSLAIAPPRLAAAPAALECRVHSIQEIGNNRLILGIVHHVRLRPSLYDPTTRRIIQEAFHPIGRMAVPDWYCHCNDRFELPRPR
jgi:flavin reductase (DIM6/NTAB) family NADH-FMN oxidoreductase RutF